MMGHNPEATRILIRGIVQGVGFRPHTAHAAARSGISGWVRNGKAGVIIHAEGSSASLQQFVSDLRERAPRTALITDIDVQEQAPRGIDHFAIRDSEGAGRREMLIPPDVSICDDCAQEILDPADRRHGYPLTNCTNCGPRFTIIRQLPYDRAVTSMASFDLCSECEEEYRDRSDRRFAAVPIACHRCGPRVRLTDGVGRDLADGEPIQLARSLLLDGAVVAVRGVGGFHLACRADHRRAVRRLRHAKSRPKKPLAVMARDLAAVACICKVTADDARMLQAPEAPIVIMPLQEDAPIVPEVTQHCSSVGVMLPYSPLHLLMFSDSLPALVMTSGNLRGMPMAVREKTARFHLSCIAEAFLTHNRPILRRCDDSVVRSVPARGGRRDFISYRRSRGYVPRPIVLPSRAAEGELSTVLGCGADEKNTFCFLHRNQAFLSQHIGSLHEEEIVQSWWDSVGDMAEILEAYPSVVARDLHPGYRSTGLAAEYAGDREIPVVPVQHHHAHLAACLAENGRSGPALGIIADGSGYGDDGTIWGMEILYADLVSYRRLVSLRRVPMPGGERAVRRPLRMALAHLHDAFGRPALNRLLQLFPGEEAELRVALRQLERGVNTPLTSSCGRLFDAVSALLGFCLRAHYSGQPAVQLSETAGWAEESMPFSLRKKGDLYLWDVRETWSELMRLLSAGKDPVDIAASFQSTVGEMMVRGALLSREIAECDVLALSGGVFQNPDLLSHVRANLREEGFTVLVPDEVPPNDGGISLGQAVIAAYRAGREDSLHVPGRSC